MTTRRRPSHSVDGVLRELGAATRSYQKAVRAYASVAASSAKAAQAVRNARSRVEAATTAYSSVLTRTETDRRNASDLLTHSTVAASAAGPMRGIRLPQEEHQ